MARLRWNLFRNSLFAVMMATSAVALTSVPTDAVAQDQVTDLIKRIEAKYKTVTSIKATVVQTQHSEVFGAETTKGEILVKRPDKLKWTFSNGKVYASNGQKMWIYNPDDKQVIEYADLSSAKSQADTFLTSLDKLTEKFEITVTSSSASGHTLELKPKTDSGFKRVMLMLDGNLVLTFVQVVDSFGNRTDLAFSGVTLNSSIDDGAFNFQIPAGATVVKGSQ